MRGSVKMEHVSVNTVDVVNLKINGIACRAPAGATVLEAAHGAGIAIPTLCYLKELNAIGACRDLRGGGEGGQEPGACLRLSHRRWDGGVHQYRAGPGRHGGPT